MRYIQKNSAILFLLVVLSLISEMNCFALPEFLLRFAQDPFSRPEFRSQCSTCHISTNGGGPRNPFGAAFEKNNRTITPEFRQAWPDYFLSSIAVSPVPTSAGEMKATFLADGQETILEIGGQHYRISSKQARLTRIEPQEAAQLLVAPAASPPAVSREPKLPLREQPTFDHYLVNLPTTLPYQRGTFSMRFTHRFSKPVLGCDGCNTGIDELLGLDSFAYASLGGEYGVHRRVAVTMYRSSLDKTFEMGGIFQLLRQSSNVPVSATARITVEGRNNFQESYTTNLVFPVSRSFSDFAEIFVAPMASINANPFAPEALPTDPAGTMRSNSGAIGLGASIRIRPRTAFVMEWIPRIAGYHATDSRNAYSFGLQRSTNGHIFELTLANSVGTTTSRAVNNALGEFSLGFNIYRRLHGSGFE